MLEDYFWRSFENCLFEDIFKLNDEIFLRIILQLLRKPYALAGCKLYKCVAVVTCLALTWVRGVTQVKLLEAE